MTDSMLATTPLGLEVEVTEKLEQRGIIDASRVEHQRPEIYRAAVRMLGYGIAVKTVAELLGVHRHTVLAIRERASSAGAIDPYKSSTCRRLRAIITLGLEEMEERAASGKITPIEMCALIDKLELLSGGVTSRVEIVEDAGAAEFRRLIQAQAANAREMVVAGGTGSQKGRGPVLEAEVVEPPEAPEDLTSTADQSQLVQAEGESHE